MKSLFPVLLSRLFYQRDDVLSNKENCNQEMFPILVHNLS